MNLCRIAIISGQRSCLNIQRKQRKSAQPSLSPPPKPLDRTGAADYGARRKEERLSEKMGMLENVDRRAAVKASRGLAPEGLQWGSI